MLYISQQINYDYIKKVCGSDFFQDEVHVGNDRHLIFATPEMLANLKNAKTWYGDGTFKIVQSLPFSQLYSICFFAKKGNAVKQFPGCLLLMTRKRKIDYEAVSWYYCLSFNISLARTYTHTHLTLYLSKILKYSMSINTCRRSM